MVRHQCLALQDSESLRKIATSVDIWSFDWFYELHHVGSLRCGIENELSFDCPGG
jgi:hypothetical protein